MTLFIWNLEYTVIFAIANTLKEARELIISQNEDRRLEIANLSKIEQIATEGMTRKEAISTKAWQKYYKEKNSNSYTDTEDIKHIQETAPDMIFDASHPVARIYPHANE